MHYMGRPGGASATPCHAIHTLQFSCGDVIDGFALNSEHHGGKGGSESDELSLTPDLYICDIEYGMRNYRGHLILSALRFHLSDSTTFPRNNGQIGGGTLTNSMTRDICSINPEAAGKNFRVLALGSKTGDFTDALLADVVIDFIAAPKVYDHTVTALYDGVGRDGSLTQYTEQVHELTHSFIKSYKQTNTISVNASADGKFGLAASIGCNYTNVMGEESQFTDELQATLTDATTRAYNVPEHGEVQAMFLGVDGFIYDIGQNGTSEYIFIPDPNAAPQRIRVGQHIGGLSAINGAYDLNSFAKDYDLIGEWSYEDPAKNGGMYVISIPDTPSQHGKSQG